MFRIPLHAAMAVATIGALLATGASLSGCAVVAVGGGAVAGYAVLAEDLPAKQQLRDFEIKNRVQAVWGQFNQELAHRLQATVFDGQVLITGRVPDQRWREEAVRRARGIADVRRVFDQMSMGPDTHFIDAAHDSWITTQLRGELIADVDIKSINYVINTTDGIVYIMGIARTRDELDRVIGHARTVAGVRRVTPFVHVMTRLERESPQPPDDVNASPRGEDETPLPLDENGDDLDEDQAAPPQGQPPASRPPARGTIKAEPLP